MEKTLILSGIGGQGIQLLGKSIIAAANELDMNLCFFPTYTGMRRGGYSYCRIIISDDRVGSPSKPQYDFAALMDADSYDYFRNIVKPGGIMLLNSDLVTEFDKPEGVEVISQPFTSFSHEIGNPLSFNVILAGFIAELINIAPNELIMEELLKKVAKTEEMRVAYTAAFNMGVDKCKEYKKGA